MAEKILESLSICLVLAIDVLIICFNYGLSKIKIPLKTVFSISLVNFLFAGIGAAISYIISGFVAGNFIDFLSISLLFMLGVYNLIKFFIKNRENDNNYDKNSDFILSSKEGFYLSLVLIPDGFCASLACGRDLVFTVFFLAFFLISTFLAIFVSSRIGYFLSRKIRLNLSWLSPVALISFSVIKLFVLLF